MTGVYFIYFSSFFSNFFASVLCFLDFSKNPDAEKRLGAVTTSAVLYCGGYFRLIVSCAFSEDQLIRKTFSAFRASSLEYVSAVSSSHSLSEAVLLLSLSFLGLVCSEHFLHLLNFFCKRFGSVSCFFRFAPQRATLFTMTTYIIST